MLKQNQRSEKIFQKPRNFHLNRPLLMGVTVCLLSISLMTSASAKELHINLTESLDMNNNDKKPKDLAKKATLKEKTKSEKKEIKKPEKPKPKPTVKAPYYPTMDDMRMKKIYNSEPDHRRYYLKSAFRLLQMAGRSVRHVKDYAMTYVLDSKAERMVYHQKNDLPKWFIDACDGISFSK